MDIKDHIIVGAQFKQTPNIFGLPFTRPKYLIIHYTVSGETAGTVAWLTKRSSGASAHIVIGRDGEVWQLASFDQMTWHCGDSAWNGDTHLNFLSIGIELVNWGPVELDKDGKSFRSKWGQVVPADEVEQATHKNESSPRYWHKYTREQLAKGAEVARAILQAYPSIEDVLGHDDIAPTRKIDPGPLFPMERFLVECGWKEAPVVAPITTLAIRDLWVDVGGASKVFHFTVADKEGEIATAITRDEAIMLRDWIDRNLKS